EKCGTKVLIDVSYDEQLEARKEEGDTGKFPVTPNSIQEPDHTGKFTSIPTDDNFQAEDTGKFPPILESNSIRPESFRPSDDSNNPPSASPVTILQEWLSKRRGTPRIIWATGSTQAIDKYLSKGENYQPDLEAFIAGKIGHIYGSKLINPQTGKTWVLSFDCDEAEHDDQAQDNMLSLARAGAAPIYWQRNANERRRGHFEFYFDRPVDPEVARLWALEICPELEDIPECYPCLDKKNNALSWPLYQRIGGEVFPCTAYAILPAPHEAGMQDVDPT